MNASELPRMPQFHIIDAAAPQGVQSPRSYQGQCFNGFSTCCLAGRLAGWWDGWLVGCWKWQAIILPGSRRDKPSDWSTASMLR